MAKHFIFLNGKRWFQLVVLAVLIVVLFLISLLLVGLLNPAYVPSMKTLSLVQGAIEKQKKVEENIRSYYQGGQFTFENPLVIQDPYGRAPLTALILFDTPNNAQISIHVPGKSEDTGVNFTFPGYQKYHEIPVYGLYAGITNTVLMRMRTEGGEERQIQIELETEPLPTYLLNIKVDQVNRSSYSEGFNFTFEDHKTIFDIDGAVRWYSPDSTFQVFTQLMNGRYLYTYRADNDNVVMEQDLLGKIYSVYNIEDGIHHDIVELPDGNLLVTSEDRKSGIKEDFIYEVERSSGHIIRSFDFKTILDENRPNEINTADNDWLHLNSIHYDPSDQSIIISSRAQSAVVKLSYPEMVIKWILGVHDNWSEAYTPFLLTPQGEDFEWPWSQHHATVVGRIASEEDALIIQLFDNGLYRSFDQANAFSPRESYSRVVHYKVNEKLRTVEQVWEYGKVRGDEIFTHSASSAYKLTNGNILGTWGNITKDGKGQPMVKNSGGAQWEAKIIEVDPKSNEVVFESTLGVMINYRTFRAGFYDGYSEENDLLFTQINDTSDNDLVDRAQMLLRDFKYSKDPIILFIKRLSRSIMG